MISAFGATEGCSFLTAGKPDDLLDVRVGTLGSSMDGTEIRIIDLTNGNDAPPEVVGEILYRGPQCLTDIMASLNLRQKL